MKLRRWFSPESRIQLDADEPVLLRGHAMRGKGALGGANWGSLILTDRRLLWRALARDLDIPLADIVEVRSAGFFGQLAFNGRNLEVRVKAGETFRFGLTPDGSEIQTWVEKTRQMTIENALSPKTFTRPQKAPSLEFRVGLSALYLFGLLMVIAAAAAVAKAVGLG